MKKIQFNTAKVIKGALKNTLRLGAFLILLLILVVVALQHPTIQRYAAQKATAYLSEKVGYHIEVKGISIDWFDIIELQDVYVRDPYKHDMIYAKEIDVDYTVHSLWQGKVTVEKATIRDAHLHVIRYRQDNLINMTEFIDRLKAMGGPQEPSNKPPVPFQIDDVSLDNVFFSYDDERKPYSHSLFDNNHFEFDSLTGDFEKLRFAADTVMVDIVKMKASLNASHIYIHDLYTSFLLDKRNIVFNNLKMDVGSSHIEEYIRLAYKDINDLSDFNTKVDLDVRLRNTYLDFRDVKHFFSDMKNLHDIAKGRCNVKGRVNRFAVTDMEVDFGKSSLIKGELSFIGLPDLGNTVMDLSFKEINLKSSDLHQYLGPVSNDIIGKMGYIYGKGDFLGAVNDFVAQGKFTTALGKFESDINIKINEQDQSKSLYEGDLITTNFNLGEIVDAPFIKSVDMDGKVRGKGYTFRDKNDELQIEADISRIQILDYTYSNIKVRDTLKQRSVYGEIMISDSNLTLKSSGKVDFSSDTLRVNSQINIQKADLYALGFSPTPSQLIASGMFNFKVHTLDDLIGEASVSNTYLTYKDRDIYIKRIKASTTLDKSVRKVAVESDFFDVLTEGNFTFSRLSSDLQRQFKEYRMFFLKNKTEMAEYYKTLSTPDQPPYAVDFSVHLKKINDLLPLYVPELFISEQTRLKGRYRSSYTSLLNLSTQIDTLIYGHNEFVNSKIDLSTSKISDSANVLAMLYLYSEKQKINSVQPTENFEFQGLWDKDLISFSTFIKQQRSTNNIELNGDLALREKDKVLKIRNSHLDVLDRRWKIGDSNAIYIQTKDFYVENFKVFNAEQSLGLSGNISNDESKIAKLDIKNFKLETFQPLIKSYKLKGVVNSRLVLTDILELPGISGQLRIDSFHVDHWYVGNISGLTSWNHERKELNLTSHVERFKKNIVKLHGLIRPLNKKDQLDLMADLLDTDLEILSPFFTGFVSQLKGKALGSLSVKGSLDDIRVKGEAHLKACSFKLDYMGTTYSLDDRIYFDHNEITFRKMLLKDMYNNKAYLSGGIYHDNFTNYLIDLQGVVTNFQCLNTNEKDNSLFYGEAIATGTFEVLGAVSDLQINATMKSNKNTRIFIPINGTYAYERQSYIHFTQKGAKKLKDTIDLSGIKMDLNLEVTPEAYTEIIFDKKAGDIIHAHGQGNLKLAIDTRGDFNIYGDYVIKEGGYNFTLAGLINKDFIIEPNSRLSWSGDPYQGELNVKARYLQDVSIRPIIGDTSLLKLNEAIKTYPLHVVMGLTGNLLAPDITLDMEFKRYPSEPAIASYVADFQSRIKSNEQELNRQVFSVIVLRRLSPLNSFSSSGGGSNISELLSNQLSNFLSQVDENLQVDVNLRNLDKDALNTFRLRLSYTMMDGRLRITRDGNFQNVQSSQQNQVANIAGEWTLEYLLSEDGRFRMKLYNKINQNSLLTSLNNTSNTAGFSLLHTQTFSSLKDLFRRKEEEEPPIPEPEKPKEPENKESSTPAMPPQEGKKEEDETTPNK